MLFLQKLLRASAARGLKSQASVEVAIGLAKNRISKWLNGQGDPSWEEVVRWARAVDAPLDWLADDDARPVRLTSLP